MLARIDFLQDTVKHFNSTNRGVFTDEEGGQGCAYAAGCAIGRHIPLGLANELDTYSDEEYNGSAVCEPAIFNKLPENLRELGQSFLSRIQNLHDAKGNWDENGLTPVGLDYYKLILEYILRENVPA
jgi:hypothetical protein